MGSVVYFFGSGSAFFAGVSCILIAIVVSYGWFGGWSRLSSSLLILGMVVVAASATPLPFWFYVVALSLTLAWQIAQRWRTRVSARWMEAFRVAILMIWLSGVALELPYHFPPTVAADAPRIYLFGDSVSAGVTDDQTNNWPYLLANDHRLEVLNFSSPGATVAVALRRANAVSFGDGIVLLEIGGNDLLGTTTDMDFCNDLEELLQQVCQAGRQVLMFELPLPPFRGEYGRIQRRLAKKYEVALIPKRIFISVLTSDGATLDSIHLSTRGQRRMADAVWRILHSAYDKPS